MSSTNKERIRNYRADQMWLPSFVMNYFQYIKIIFFQIIGTSLFAYGICCSQFQPPPFPIPNNYQPITNPGHSPFVSLSLLLGICWCGQISGGHCNPAVTLAFMLKKNSTINLKFGLIYMISQIIGAFIGCGFAWLLVNEVTAPIVSPNLSAAQQFQEFGGQIFGTFLFVFFILVFTTTQTTFINTTLKTYVMIVTILYIARTFSFRTEGLNPALAIGMETFYAINKKNFTIFAQSWILIIGPYIGAAFSVLIFQQIYFPLLILWKRKS